MGSASGLEVIGLLSEGVLIGHERGSFYEFDFIPF
jgi:hypothetical protein